MEKDSEKKTYFIITCSGGGGVLQAAKAQKQRLEKRDPTAKIIVKDIMMDGLGKFIGNICVSLYNNNQKKGNVKSQEILIWFHGLADIFFWPQVFYFVFRTLLKEDVDYVYDSQPLATSAVIKAIRLFNFISKKKLVLRKIFVDPPSKKATHYFNNIKGLSKKDREHVYISTIEPLLGKYERDEDFWQRHCKIPLSRVCYKSYPIRLDFDAYLNKKRDLINYKIKIKTENKKELGLIDEVRKLGNIEGKKNADTLELIINPNDFLITILLGSQPSLNATLNYVKNLIFFVKNYNVKRKIDVFCYCSVFNDGLIKKMHNMIMTVKDFPNNLNIVPMSFQNEDVIALLFFRSDMTVTRSGGQTAVELLRISKAKICVHSEYNGDNPTEKKLLKGIPAWESGSASYMKEVMDASIVNPDVFVNLCKDLIHN